MVRKLCALLVLLFFIPIVSAYADINVSRLNDVPKLSSDTSMPMSPISMTVPYPSSLAVTPIDSRIGVDGVMVFGFLISIVLVASVKKYRSDYDLEIQFPKHRYT